MKLLIFYLAKFTGLFALCRFFTRGNLRILAYHGIWLGEGHYGNFLYMSPAKFARRMDYLANSNYSIVSLNDAFGAERIDRLPTCSVAVTIDDGWYSTYQHMLPALEANNIPATIYVTTYHVLKNTPVFEVAAGYMLSVSGCTTVDTSLLDVPGLPPEILLADEASRQSFLGGICQYAKELRDEAQRQLLAHKLGEALAVDYASIDQEKLFHLMDYLQLRDASRRGFDLQLHTHRHRVYDKGSSCLDRELKDNKQVLAEVGTTPLEHFCYPSGENDETMWPVLRSHGVKTATTTRAGLVGPDSSVYALPRILDGELLQDIEFEAELSGFCELLRWLRGRH